MRNKEDKAMVKNQYNRISHPVQEMGKELKHQGKHQV